MGSSRNIRFTQIAALYLAIIALNQDRNVGLKVAVAKASREILPLLGK